MWRPYRRLPSGAAGGAAGRRAGGGERELVERDGAARQLRHGAERHGARGGRVERLEELHLVPVPLALVEVHRVDGVARQLMQRRARVVTEHLHVRLD